MKTKIKGYIKTLRRPRYGIPAALLLILALWITNAARGTAPEHQTRAAARTTVAQEVTATGNVKSANAVDLAFERSGKVASIAVKVGDHVAAGQPLASLSNGDIASQLASQRANLDRERIKLSQLVRGVRAEEAAVSGASVDNAKIALGNAKAGLVDKLNDAFVKADDAIRNHADRLFENPVSMSPSFGVTVTSGSSNYRIAGDSATNVELSYARRTIGDALKAWQSTDPNADIDAFAKRAESNLVTIQDFVNKIAGVVNSYEGTNVSADTVYQSYRTDVSTARTAVSSALSSLRTAMQAYASAKASLEIAERQNSLKLAPPTQEELGIQEANVRQAEAGVSSAESELAKTVIVSPVDGVVTKLAVEKGEIISLNTPAVSVIADSKLEIEVNIPEADLSRVRPGASADVTFDAYGRDYVAKATVASVDPAATTIDGVPTYRTILAFVEPDDRIKSGMTANITIMGESKAGVLAVPQRSVTTDGGEKTVRVLVDGEIEERVVTTGLRGTDGNIEILSGLSEGDLVVTSASDEENK